jgi:hypothetical protein
MAANRLDQLIDQFEPVLRRAFMESVYNVRDAAQLDQITRMLENGDVPGAIRAVGLDPTQFRPFDKSIADAFEAGGNFTSKAMPLVSDTAGFKTVFQFSVRNFAAENWLRTHSSSLVQNVIDDQREMIRGFLSDGLAKGVNPRTSALDLVGRISCRDRQARGWNDRPDRFARGMGAGLCGRSRQRQSTRRRSRAGCGTSGLTRAVRKAAAKGEPVPAELRNKMVTAYRNRALRYRAETIARTETIAALHTAQDQALDQAVGTGAIRPAQITMTWRSAHDARVRDAHRELDGETIRRGGVFQSELGPIRYPGDPNADIANTANCRCFLEPSVDFLAGLT